MAVKDPLWSKVLLALHLDSDLLVDLKGHGVVGYGTGLFSTEHPKFGAKTLAFNGTDSYIDIALGSALTFEDDFTIEFFVFKTGAGYLHLDSRTWGDYSNFTVGITPGGIPEFLTTAGRLTPESPITLNQWVHLAVVRSGNTISMFRQGVKYATTLTHAGPMGLATQTLSMGKSRDPFMSTGFATELRITKAARYLSNFTPPTEPFPNGAYEVTGVVRDTQGNAAPRNIRVYRRDTGLLVGAGSSSALTGEFSISVAHDGECQVVLLDNEYGTVENDQIIRAFPI